MQTYDRGFGTSDAIVEFHVARRNAASSTPNEVSAAACLVILVLLRGLVARSGAELLGAGWPVRNLEQPAGVIRAFKVRIVCPVRDDGHQRLDRAFREDAMPLNH
jgi:hypothetical protein